MRCWKSSRRSRDAGAIKFVPWIKKHQYLKKIACWFNYKPKLCQNAVFSLNGMHLNIPPTECQTYCRGLKDLSYGPGVHSLCEIARSLCFKAWSMIVASIPVYDILISSPSRVPQSYMYRIIDKLTQWSILTRWWSCHRGANRHEIWVRLGKRKFKYKVLRWKISFEINNGSSLIQ